MNVDAKQKGFLINNINVNVHMKRIWFLMLICRSGTQSEG